MTFIYISVSLKTSNNLENKLKFERSNCTMTVHKWSLLRTCNSNETQQRYHIKSKNCKLVGQKFRSYIVSVHLLPNHFSPDSWPPLPFAIKHHH